GGSGSPEDRQTRSELRSYFFSMRRKRANSVGTEKKKVGLYFSMPGRIFSGSAFPARAPSRRRSGKESKANCPARRKKTSSTPKSSGRSRSSSAPASRTDR